MKLIISGAAGFIGKHLVKRLLKENHSVCAVVRSSTNLDYFKKEKIKFYIFDGDIKKLIFFMQKENFNGTIHLASLFLTQHQPEDIRGLIDSNVFFATILLEASIQSQIPWFINTGTFWQHYHNKRYSPVNLYAATKQAFEDIAKYYIESSPINFVTLKLSDTFGPVDTRPKIFNLWFKISQTKEKLDMSPGEQIIDISYVDNVIDGYVRLIKLLSRDKAQELKGKSFAIKSNKRVTLKKLANIFEKVTKTKLNINWGERKYWSREVMIPWNKGRTIPGWKSKISIQEGIKKTFNYKR